jgi:hypothetical protein
LESTTIAYKYNAGFLTSSDGRAAKADKKCLRMDYPYIAINALPTCLLKNSEKTKAYHESATS